MKLIVKARHMTLTPALKAHVEEKLGDPITRIFDRPAATLEVELTELGRTQDGLNKECRVTVFMPKDKTINIVETAEDMYKAIDLTHDRLINQVKRQRSKKRDTMRKGSVDTKGIGEPSEETWEKEVAEFESSG